MDRRKIAERLDQIKSSCGVNVSTNNVDVCRGADVILFCIKPHNALAVLEPLGSVLTADKLLISTVAALPIDKIKAVVESVAVIRAMRISSRSVPKGSSL